jgi:hypothetical protein
MLTAEEILQYNLGSTDGDREIENKRRREFFLRLSEAPPEIKTRLVQELLSVAANQNEPFIRRLRAVNPFWMKTEELGIAGSVPVANALIQILENEFLRVYNSALNQAIEEVRTRLTGLNAEDLLFLKTMLQAVFLVDYPNGRKITEVFLVLLDGTEFGESLKTLVATTKEGRIKRGLPV